MSIISAKKQGPTLFFSGLSETLDATEEAGGKVKSEPMGTATFLITSITSEVKYMMEYVWMCCEECYL
eukprot:scaffold51778_cov17-Cyclotella_meneghiniana.AAC.1